MYSNNGLNMFTCDANITIILFQLFICCVGVSNVQSYSIHYFEELDHLKVIFCVLVTNLSLLYALYLSGGRDRGIEVDSVCISSNILKSLYHYTFVCQWKICSLLFCVIIISHTIMIYLYVILQRVFICNCMYYSVQVFTQK